MKEVVKLFKALSDENRLKLLMLISKKNICAKGISNHLNISEAAVSQHIKILKDSNLIVGEKKGYHIIYNINEDSMVKIRDFISLVLDDKSVVSFNCKIKCSNKRCYYKRIMKEGIKMKVGFPVNNNLGMESVPFEHFGSAPMFVVCDLEKGEVKTINNGDLGHEHGNCNPMKALSGEKVDAVIVGGIGMGAVKALNRLGIKVFKAIKGTLQDNIEAYKEGKLEDFTLKYACNHDGCEIHLK